MEGGFWSSISHLSTSKKDKRLAEDQAGMQLIQQWMALVLNRAAFGTSDPDNLVGQAQDAFDDFTTVTLAECDDEIANDDERGTLICLAGAIAAINEGGSEISFNDFNPGFDKGPTSPKDAKANAEVEEWDAVLGP